MASKKSSAELKQEAAVLSDQLADARKKPMNFAWLIGKEGLVLETDLKKSPEVLWRTAKKNGGGPKGAQGQISVSGKTIQLTSDSDEVPTQLPKLAKRFLSERGLAYKIVLITPGGEFSDGEEDAADDAQDDAAIPEKAEIAREPAPAPEPAVTPVADAAPVASRGEKAAVEADSAGEEALRKKLQEEFAALSEALDKASRSRNKGAAKKARTLADLFRTQIETDVKKSRAVLSLLAKTVEDAVGFGVGRGRAERSNLLAGLETEIDALLAEFA